MRDRDLVRLYWPAELRPAFDALFDVDDAMGDVVAKATEPALAAIKLAWWRERLEELDEGKVPAEPRLQAAARELLPRGITGASLAGLEDGWEAFLEEQPDIERAGHRGVLLVDLASSLLGATDRRLDAAGRLYARESVGRRGRLSFHWPIDDLNSLAGHRFPRALRPLTALVVLAARDSRREGGVEPEATPGRAIALLKHRLTGRVA